ncbi:MAG: type II toxin-antitoxin system RelE/ParE family toxin [Candidatus Colwellbacteria bacterium]|nr:type II toxin-antitoxin system RelE/ParE family toxin [Candidatus Colwellbacteria bacterium]
MVILFKPAFIRQYKNLDSQLKEEVKEKIDLFKNPKKHKQLKVHKLTGRLSSRYSFSVNYKFRIVFSYASKNSVVLLAIGDHNIYK